MTMLEGKKLLITGVVTKQSIAFAVAEQAQRDGAEVLLTGFGRARRLTERAAKRAARPARGAGAGREQARGHRGAGRRPEGALGSCRRRAARHRLRARGGAGRQLPGHPVRQRRPGLRHQRLLAQGAGRRAAPAAGRRARGRQRRGPGLRRLRGLAVLRLDGRVEGGAGIRLALPGPRPRLRRHAREPGGRRPDRHRGGGRHPRLRRPGRSLAAPGATGLGQRRRRAPWPTRSASCSATARARSAARSCTPTAASTRWGPCRRSPAQLRCCRCGPVAGNHPRPGRRADRVPARSPRRVT